MKIVPANKKNISESPDLPDVSIGIQMYFQPIKISLVYKQNKDGYLQEFLNTFSTQGFRMAQSPQQLMMKPEGERDWKWSTLFTFPDLQIKVDDIITINKVKYRVMNRRDNREYGVQEFELLEDYVDES